MVVALHGLSLPFTPLQSGNVVVVVVVMVMVDVAVRLVFLMVHAVAVAVLVRVAVVIMETVIQEAAFPAHGFVRVQRGSLTLRGGAVLPHLVDEEDLRHVVYDEHLSPLRDRLGLSTTEMNVHDEDGERGGGCDHSHGGYVVLPYEETYTAVLICRLRGLTFICNDLETQNLNS